MNRECCLYVACDHSPLAESFVDSLVRFVLSRPVLYPGSQPSSVDHITAGVAHALVSGVGFQYHAVVEREAYSRDKEEADAA